MSTEHQQYSIDNQADALSRYAQEHDMEIVRTYMDSAKSGFTIENRPGLRQLIADLESGFPGYTAVLIYDVSRWGAISRRRRKRLSMNIGAVEPRPPCTTAPSS